MKPLLARSTLISLGLAGGLFAQDAAAPPAAPEAIAAAPSAPAEPSAEPATEADPATEAEPVLTSEEKHEQAMKDEQEKLSLENSLAEEKLKKETAGLRAEITRLKVEKELLSERLSMAAMKRQADDEAANAKMEAERSRLIREGEIAKVEAEVLANELKAAQARAGIEVTRLQGQISEFEIAEKRKHYADSEPVYLKQPLRDDGVLVISDRRIALNGAITGATADYVCDRIQYFNNRDREMPIFLVIDESPGGSVMAGYRILKSMQSSDAPVHVVVKSFAASMAAAITTLAEESYAYPNSVILHHQISAMLIGRLNLTQQAEFVKDSERWWTRLATPIADKMGITKEDMIKRMYEQNSSGDWSEFGEQAKELKWVNHIVTGVEESSLLRSPDAETDKPASQRSASVEALDEEGRPVMYLPRISPKDVYFLYNPDGYYQVR